MREDGTRRPLAGIEVMAEGTKRSTTTDTAGRYILADVPKGNRVVLFRGIAYIPSRVRIILVSGDTARADAILVPHTPQLDSIVVVGALRKPRGIGLETLDERKRTHIGVFIDSVELRRSEHRLLTDVLRSHGLKIVRYRECYRDARGQHKCPTSYEERIAGRTSFGNNPENECWMQVIFDGIVIYRAETPSSTGRGTAPGPTGPPPPDLRREFSPSMLAAIEIYKSAAVTPLEFSGRGAECGTVVMWSRRGP